MPIPSSIPAQPAAMPHRAGERVVLSIKGLRKAFGGQVVLDDVDADLREGEVVLLRGDNGSGKTTLLNILTGNLEPDAGTIHLRTNVEEETFRFPRNWWESLNPFDHFTPERVATEGVGRTWQDVRLFPTLSLLDNIAVARQRQPEENPLQALFSRSRTTTETANQQASATLLANLDLGERIQSSGDKISLGQSKRVAIARAVQAGARILFLDEPLSGLDAAGIEEVLGLLSSLARNERITLVIVEHTFNIPRVLEFASTVWTLSEGRVRLHSPAQVRAGYSSDSSSGAIALVSELLGATFRREELSLHRGARLTRFVPKGATTERPVLLEIRDLLVRRGARLVIGNETGQRQIEPLSFSLYQGDIAILQAPNGWGKTTLLDAITGTAPIARGEIFLKGNAIHELPVWRRIQHGLSVLPSRNQLFGNLTVVEVGCLSELKRAQAGNFLCLDALAGRRVSSLSGGERQRLGLASIPVGCVRIYDEPFSALDNSSLQTFLRANDIQDTESVLVLLPQN